MPLEILHTLTSRELPLAWIIAAFHRKSIKLRPDPFALCEASLASDGSCYDYLLGNIGGMNWLSPGACRQNRKRRDLLNKSLQQFFDIEGEPIELTDDRKGWRCLFKVQDEN